MIQFYIDKNMWGICLFDKFCYISGIGFEILK